MALLGMQDVSIAFGGPPVLDRASFHIERGERVCLLGRNGAGKSTLMKLLDGTIAPDSGDVMRETGASVARLEQEVPDDVDGHHVRRRRRGARRARPAARALSRRVAPRRHRRHARPRCASSTACITRSTPPMRGSCTRASRRCSRTSGSTRTSRSRAASGGRKRQTLLARALVREPDVLLLDEPTNHLDIDAIEWMEEFLIDRGTTLLFVTHDRAFLRRVATRIVELDRGRLVDWGGDYDTYLERKEAALAAEAREWAEFDKKLAKEEVWIRTGIQARRTRNEGRVRALEALRVERGARRERAGTVRLQAQEAERSGRAGRRERRRELRARRARRSSRTSARRSRAATASA